MLVRPMPRTILVLFLLTVPSSLLLAVPSRAQAKPTEVLRSLEQELERGRKALEHAQLLSRYEQLAKTEDAVVQRTAARRIALLAQEIQLVEKVDRALVRTGPVSLLAALEKLELTATEQLALAKLCVLHGRRKQAEGAIGRARDLDPRLVAETNRLLAEVRGTRLPRGGFHRYRGAWYGLADRDRARAFDTAWEALHAVNAEALQLPLPPEAGRSKFTAFERLGAKGPELLRASAAKLRKLLRRDYAAVRAWLTTYAAQPQLRSAIAEKRSEAAKVQTRALALIRRYSKPEQGQVDELRAELEELYADFEALRKRETYVLARTTPEAAHELRARVIAGEAALAAVDRYLASYAGGGLPVAQVTAARGALVTKQRFLPGRAQSELEDVLWLLVHHRAGLMHDVAARADELLRQRKRLTAWEVYQIERMQIEAIEAYNESAAVSLDATERVFMLVTNRYRKTLGLRPFEIEERCNVASRKHSQEMVDLGYFGHMSPVPRNRGPSDRVRLEGYNGGVGENCLAGSVDGRGAFEAWYHSPGHHRNLISAGPHLGVGATSNHAMWTMVAGGNDRSWRLLHRDLAPARRAALRKLAVAFATAARTASRNASAKARASAEQALGAARAVLPDILPDVARIAFPAANDSRHKYRAAFPDLIAFLLDSNVDVRWRPLQIAAIAAGIETLRHAKKAGQRRAMLSLLAPIVGDTFGYDPDANAKARLDAVLLIRRHWEDVAQWKFRRTATAKAPEPASIPGRGDGPSLDAPLRVLTRRERLALAKQWGGGKETESAVERGLLWLSKVQDEDGAWRARSFVLTNPKFDSKSGMGSGEYEIAMTGLSLLAFVSAGHTTAQGDYRDHVRKGAAFLRSRISDYGKFESSTGHYMYGHAIATQALAELYAMTADPDLWLAAQEAVDYLMFAQHRPSGGWRYYANQQADTSVTIWVIQALNAAFKARLDVAGFRDSMRFLDYVTTSDYFRVGYTSPQNPKEGLEPVAMAGRLFLGGSRGDPRVTMPARRLMKKPPSQATYDFYSWYYGTLAMFQLGGEFWDVWHAGLVDVMLDKQVTKRNSVYYGSWPPDGRWGRGAGRIYQTTLGVLILTTYYRYDRGPKARVFPFTGDLDAALLPYLKQLRGASDPRVRRIVLLKMVDLFGAELASPLLRVVTGDAEELELRRTLAALLPTVCERQHEGALLAKLGHKDAKILSYITESLTRVCTRRSVSTLCAHLEHENRAVRRFAANALGELADASASPALSTRLGREPDAGCKQAISRALLRLGSRSAMSAVVQDALGEGEPGLLLVLRTLDLLERRGLADKLLACKESEGVVYQHCLDAIRQHREASTTAILIELLESADLDTRTESVKLLQALTGKRMGFDPKSEVPKRRDAQQKWKLWWLAYLEASGVEAAVPDKDKRR